MAREMNIIRYSLMAVLLAVWLLLGCPAWVTDPATPLPLRAALYPFFHGNVFHLGANLLAVWLTMGPRTAARCKPCRDLFLSFLVSFLVYPLAPVPPVGISNAIYCIIGLRTPPLRSRWWRTPPVLLFLALTLAMTAVPRISALTHIAAFIAGTLIAALRRWLETVLRDAYHYIRRS